MKQQNIHGSYAQGGITGLLVDMLNEGLFRALLDVQCFDLKAVSSIRENPCHCEVSAEQYASPGCRSAAVDSLDVAVLGATEIDTSFNINVHTDSNATRLPAVSSRSSPRRCSGDGCPSCATA